MKNATEVDCGGVRYWCGVVVPTMIETVAAAQRMRNVFHYTH